MSVPYSFLISPTICRSKVIIGSSLIQVTNLKYLLLNVWDEVEEAGGNEDSAREAGAETDESLPASPGGEVGVVSEL